MKKLIYFGMGLALCMGAALLTGCEKKPLDEPAADNGSTEPAKVLEASMVYVEGGTFQMGATPEQGYDDIDGMKPVHSVTLDGFYIGKYEVTQAQWKAVMGTTIEQQCDKAAEDWNENWEPDRILYGVGDTYPMYYVSWEQATAFCTKLSEMMGKRFRLPTEAEWEYAARGGNKADGTRYAGSNIIGEVAWYRGNSYGLGENHPDFGTHPVGQKMSNGLGIYDMTGNVWELCSDWWDYYNNSPAVNPQGPSSGLGRVCRGGSIYEDTDYTRVSFRHHLDPNLRGLWGFRVVCER